MPTGLNGRVPGGGGVNYAVPAPGLPSPAPRIVVGREPVPVEGAGAVEGIGAVGGAGQFVGAGAVAGIAATAGAGRVVGAGGVSGESVVSGTGQNDVSVVEGAGSVVGIGTVGGSGLLVGAGSVVGDGSVTGMAALDTPAEPPTSIQAGGARFASGGGSSGLRHRETIERWLDEALEEPDRTKGRPARKGAAPAIHRSAEIRPAVRGLALPAPVSDAVAAALASAPAREPVHPHRVRERSGVLGASALAGAGSLVGSGWVVGESATEA